VLPEFCQSSLEARPSFEPIEQVLVTRRAVDPARLAHGLTAATTDASGAIGGWCSEAAVRLVDTGFARGAESQPSRPRQLMSSAPTGCAT